LEDNIQKKLLYDQISAIFERNKKIILDKLNYSDSEDIFKFKENTRKYYLLHKKLKNSEYNIHIGIKADNNTSILIFLLLSIMLAHEIEDTEEMRHIFQKIFEKDRFLYQYKDRIQYSIFYINQKSLSAEFVVNGNNVILVLENDFLMIRNKISDREWNENYYKTDLEKLDKVFVYGKDSSPLLYNGKKLGTKSLAKFFINEFQSDNIDNIVNLLDQSDNFFLFVKEISGFIK